MIHPLYASDGLPDALRAPTASGAGPSPRVRGTAESLREMERATFEVWWEADRRGQ